MSKKSHQSTLLEVQKLMRWDGVYAALQYLNGLTSHRFTGLFLFDGDQLSNTYLVDKEVLVPTCFPVMPADHSYCLMVKASGEPLCISDAINDPRVQDHPSRDSVQSYFGAALRDKQGRYFGTICHFSLVPCEVPMTHVPILSGFADVLLECERLHEIGWRPEAVY